jgi:hypothetical protein
MIASEEKCRELIDEEDRGSHHPAKSPADYRFARTQGKSVHGPLHRVSGTFRRMIEAIVDSKLRRMERELELRGIRVHEEG